MSERLEHNKDKMSLNNGKITIDDDGNMNMASSPSPSPPPMMRHQQSKEGEAPNDEAKTFVSSHLLFSHLMSIDGNKNTLSKLNKASRHELYSKGFEV